MADALAIDRDVMRSFELIENPEINTIQDCECGCCVLDYFTGHGEDLHSLLLEADGWTNRRSQTFTSLRTWVAYASAKVFLVRLRAVRVRGRG